MSIIKLKTSTVAGKVPTAAQLALGELAVNTNDGKLFIKKTTGGVDSIITIGAVADYTSADTNVFDGYQALNTGRTSSTQNVAVGYQALSALTNTGSVAVGYQALMNATGFNNCAVGWKAMTATTSGQANCAFGINVMVSNLGGGSNAVFGNAGLYSNTSGTNNSGFGGGALYGNTIGTYNTGVGFQALIAASTANFNTTVGALTMSSVTGSSNTAIGYLAGVGAAAGAATAATSGSNNTYIGANSAPSSAAASNTITLGNSAITTIRAQVTSITALSDARDKTDVAPLKFGLDFINSLNPVSFTWNMRDGGKVGIKSSGFIAQELKAAQDAVSAQEILNLVSEENPEKLEATYGHLIPVLVKALQELSKEVELLRGKLKSEVRSLKTEMASRR